jgi:hypothetical protein
LIFLIGTNHELQHDAPARRARPEIVNPARDRFRSYLMEMASWTKVAAIAEEFAEEVLSHLRANSICCMVAHQMNIAHKFCEPTTSERLKLGIPAFGTEGLPEDEKLKSDQIRRAFWLDKLMHFDHRPALFVCGADHVDSFAKMLRDSGIGVAILCDYWGKEIYTP